ncbi:MAG: 30S ribosomal protein S12 methylthiotransferase RimO [Bacteroidales bacterium]|nr:30S ribosomal protein S12 methylthiotransferase RimO [Bacteroidales bacterium]
MEKKTLQVITLGCSKNSVDTSHLLSQVQDLYTVLPEDYDGHADYLLLNTCGFIGDAKEQSIQAIFDAVDRKNRGLADKILVFGCLSQRYMDQLPAMIPEVDGWYGARELAPLVKALGGPEADENDYGRFMPAEKASYAFMKISEGCDRRCSYCAIPLIRGLHRSVPMEKLVREAETLAARGVKELVLIAQDTTFYGLDLYKKRSLAELLRRLSAVNGIEWIRIHYSYPADFPEDVLEEMATNSKVCKYLDIPLQHVADSVLSAMRRNVDAAWTKDLVRKMREKVPGIVLRTTMMVGHPGESRKDFEFLLDFLREARFERLGAFKYSEEEGTWGAQHLRDSVAPKTKERRLAALMEVQRGISFAYNLSRIGTVEKVLADSYSDGILVCRSQYESPEVDGEILVRYDSRMGVSPEQMPGHFFNAKIVSADEYDLIADFESL